MSKRPITFNYIVFYILFLQDTYQLLVGVVVAVLLAPQLIKPETGIAAKILLYFMVGTIGYAVAAKPGQWISEGFKKLILGDRRPGRGG